MSRELVATFKNVPAALKALDRLEEEIRTAPTLERLDAAARTAAAIQQKFRPIKEVSDKAGETWITADERLGRELAKIPRAKGTRGDFKGRNLSGSPKKEPPEADAPTLAELGVARKRAARAQRIASIPEKKRKQYITELKEEDKAITPDALLRKQREESKQTKIHIVASRGSFSSDGPFDCVVIDPPWPMAKIDRDERPNQDAFDYPVMSEDEIIDFWQSDMKPRLADDCHVFMWTTQRFLPAALRIIEHVGLRYVLVFVWHKSGGMQPVELPQYNCEFVVYARHGKPSFVDTKDFFCCFNAPRREHSRKPDEFYDVVRRVTVGSRVDVFSRESREGFGQYGNEIERFKEAEQWATTMMQASRGR